MKLFHKLAYFGTGGIVDLRSDAELIARYSQKLMNEREKADARARISGMDQRSRAMRSRW